MDGRRDWLQTGQTSRTHCLSDPLLYEVGGGAAANGGEGGPSSSPLVGSVTRSSAGRLDAAGWKRLGQHTHVIFFKKAVAGGEDLVSTQQEGVFHYFSHSFKIYIEWKMMELEKFSSKRCTRILLSIFLCLHAAVEDGNAFITNERKSPQSLPYLHSEAEISSFQTNMKGVVSGILQKLEKNAKELMKNRYNFDGPIKIPSYWEDLSSKASPAERLNGAVYFRDGWAKGFPNISLVGVSNMTYDGYTIRILSDVIVWKHMVFAYNYTIMENCQNVTGHIQKHVNDAHYSMSIELDVLNQTIRLVDFKLKAIGRLAMTWPDSSSASKSSESQECDHVFVLASSTKCYVAGSVQLDAFKGNGRQRIILISAFNNFYRRTIFPQVEIVLQTIVEDSFKSINVADHIPKLAYAYAGPEPGVEGEDLTSCMDKPPVQLQYLQPLLEPVTEVHFIQNSVEMWSFQKQMEEGAKHIAQNVCDKVTNNLKERGLLTGILKDDRFLMTIRDKSSTRRHAPMSLTNGRYNNSFKFNVTWIKLVEFTNGSVVFAASVSLEEDMSYIYSFNTTFMRGELHHGLVKGSVKSLQYGVGISVDLTTGVLTLEDALPDCVKEISVRLTGIPPESQWFADEVKANLLTRFQDNILPQIHAILSGTFRAVGPGVAAGDFLPKWSYSWDFRSEFDMRFGENDEDTVDVCDAERISKLEERSRRFSKLITKDGIFRDYVPNSNGEYFTHVSKVKVLPIRFISTKTQYWYFEQDLRLKMNEYMYKLLNTSAKLIDTRNLASVKIPDYGTSAEGKGSRGVRIENCWIHGLTRIPFTGVDSMEFDQRLISLWTNILAYKHLRFAGEFTISGPGGTNTKRKISVPLPPVELSLRIDIDYLGEKRVKLDYMKLECIGASMPRTNPDEKVERVAALVDGYFRETVVEYLVQIFRRVFEDAIEETQWSDFLPKVDYSRDYIMDVIFQKNVNRFQSSLNYCNGTEIQKSTLKEFYPGEEQIRFSEFLPKVKIYGLRRAFEDQIKTLMENAVGSMWDHVEKHLQKFNPPKFADNGITWSEESEESHKSLVIRAVDFQGLTSEVLFTDRDFAYGKNDTLIILYQQSFDSFKITYNLSVDGQPAGEVERGKAVATAKAPQYLLKVRFFLSNSTFSIDEFFLLCLGNLTVTVHGLRPEGDPKLEAVKDSIMESFPVWVMDEVKEVVYDMYGQAAKELNAVNYTVPWIRDREIFNVVTHEEEQKEMEMPFCKETLRAHSCSCNSTKIIRGDAPFIGSEAEWWSFSKQTKGKVIRYNKEVRRLARKFIREQALAEIMIPDLTKNFARETPQESDMATCWLKGGLAGNLATVNFMDDVIAEVGKQMKIIAHLTIVGDLKMRYNFQGKEGKEYGSGRVVGIAKNVTYKMVIVLDKDNKSAHLESFDFKCISELKINPRITNQKFTWIKPLIPDAFQGDFTAIAKRDVKKVLEMAFNYGVKTADNLPFLEKWNYEKDYGQMRLKKDPMEGHVPPTCGAA
ncbi:uncharacterized protein LOC124161453 [Ischnura elegans]|uniref:uncharacterized protein LOC124161453 n=1 Tax=Ischnura elegans TaxID=197161 RepID=UPI001ED88E02|nr:uncharacterized protein LOC124161453 [Ischnura elegans]